MSDPVGRDARGYEAGAAPHPPTGHQRLRGVANEGAFTFSHLKTVSVSDYESELVYPEKKSTVYLETSILLYSILAFKKY